MLDVQFSKEHVDKILAVVELNPALSKRKKKTLDFNLEKFQLAFNAKMKPVLDEMFGNDPKVLADMENFFLIKNYNIVPGEPYGSRFDIVTNILGENVMILGMSDGGNFKLLSFIHLLPENRDEFLMTGLLMEKFFEVLLPGVDVAEYLKQTLPNPIFVKKGIRFFSEGYDDLVFLTATAK